MTCIYKNTQRKIALKIAVGETITKEQQKQSIRTKKRRNRIVAKDDSPTNHFYGSFIDWMSLICLFGHWNIPQHEWTNTFGSRKNGFIFKLNRVGYCLSGLLFTLIKFKVSDWRCCSVNYYNWQEDTPGEVYRRREGKVKCIPEEVIRLITLCALKSSLHGR